MIDPEKILRKVAMMESFATNILNIASNMRVELGSGSSQVPRKGAVRRAKAELLRGRAITNQIKKAAV